MMLTGRIEAEAEQRGIFIFIFDSRCMDDQRLCIIYYNVRKTYIL